MILLGGYAAKSCPRAVHNRYDRTVPRPELPVAAELQQLFDTGVAFEDEVLGKWAALGLPGYTDLRDLDGDKRIHIGATIGAMRAGASVIVGGRLPDDEAGHRTGKPDLLLRAPGGGYHPADIKAHQVLGTGTDALVSTLDAPALADASRLTDARAKAHENDLIQLAHYWRMLQACGHQADSPWGAVLGTDGLQLVWYDLSLPRFVTFSRSRGRAERSALHRYDHEHAFRVRVAEVAGQREGRPTDPEPLVAPVGQAECETCPWAPVCVESLPATDLSRELRGTLSVREYLALRGAGVRTVQELADSEPAALLAGAYGAEVGHLRQHRHRLHKATVAARLARDGLVLRIKDGPLPAVPRADVEIDIDAEWGVDDRVYLWGLLITADGVSRYESFFDPVLPDEAHPARRCLDRLDTLAAQAEAAGRSLLVFHYTSPERTRARRFPPLPRGAAHPDRWIDLHSVVRAAVESRAGLGLKTVAVHGAGFRWRDEDPGGRQSQEWHRRAREGDRAAAVRLLRYNEDDVRATLTVRNWLTTVR
ncbi:putative RecB family nuclease [Actinoplanes octamycinicus]|uniref:Putative RecB family nuclease n=1 Tax=Actinoplanes octamycinicus TaxID=135948 RepID=A0A7W7H4A7_9ACTN|nr:TM0106 family RecB-like putative nuclease [Actinoplanes octamycinicus]MBB4743564.1 putative RecB family nuclease [Actinoplanes octamycinicus]GIE62447.1 recombinase RecB [Actinoplanes octamycinicus]